MADKPKQNPQQGTPLHSATGETIKWDEPGKVVEGIFIALEKGSLGGQMVVLQLPTGREAASAPASLVRSLTGLKPGTRVKIEYVGETPIEGTDRTTKQFRAWAL